MIFPGTFDFRQRHVVSRTGCDDDGTPKRDVTRSIKEIIDLEHSPESDKARAAILKIYSYESELYSSLNLALNCRDKSKIPTLGPYAYLLYKSLLIPPNNNKQAIKTLHNGGELQICPKIL